MGNLCSKGELDLPQTSTSKQSYSFEYCVLCIEKYVKLEKRECGCLICDSCEGKNKYLGKCLFCYADYPSKNLKNTRKATKSKIRKYFSDINTKSKVPCPICQTKYTRDEMLTLDCDHYFCEDDLKRYLSNFISENKCEISPGLKCPTCPEPLNSATLESLLSKDDFNTYNKWCVKKDITECPNCSEIFISEVAKLNCVSCGYYFCVTCKKKGELCDCGRISLILSNEEHSSCPGCKTPYLKDDKCDHVKCLKAECGIEFCFSCSAYRQPTMVHGCHYHRPQCKFYQDYSGNDDKYSEKCLGCKAKGSLCDRPKNLKTPRVFSIGED